VKQGERDAVRAALRDRTPAPLDDAVLTMLVTLVDRLVATPVGVTAVRDPAAVVDRHVLDALRGLDAVDAAPPGPLADVGAGGGVPSLVLAAVRPDRAVHAIEATARKAAFIEETAAAMGVAVTVHAARSEDLAAGPLRDGFACVCARALAPPPVAAELCLPLCRPGGRVVLWVGETAAALDLAPVAAQLGGAVAPAPPGFAVLEKRELTPERFPRRPGLAAKRPLA